MKHEECRKNRALVNTVASVIGLLSATAAMGSDKTIELLASQEDNRLCAKSSERGLDFAESYFRKFLKENSGYTTEEANSNHPPLRPLTDKKDAMICSGLNQYYADMINAKRAAHDGTEYHLYHVSYFEGKDTIVVAAERLISPAQYSTGHYGIFTIVHDDDLKVLDWYPDFVSEDVTDALSDGLGEKIREGK